MGPVFPFFKQSFGWDLLCEFRRRRVIEHNLDVISRADWVIDLGPEGGKRGGKVVAQGPPETIAGCKSSHTGRCLKMRLSQRP